MYKEDFELAKKIRLNAYTPYSNYQVGAVLRTKSGKVYAGCNIENHGIQAICAERVAISRAISEGEKDFELRGSGDLFGVRQSGDMVFKIANLQTDYKILLQCKKDSEEFINDNIEDGFKDYPYYGVIEDNLLNND